MSDDELAAALEALDSSDGAGEEPPPDRAELYKLLDE